MKGHWREMTVFDPGPRWVAEASLRFESDFLVFGDKKFNLNQGISIHQVHGTDFQLTNNPRDWFGVVRVERFRPAKDWQSYYAKREGGDYGSVWEGSGLPPEVRDELFTLELNRRPGAAVRMEILPGGLDLFFFFGRAPNIDSFSLSLGPAGAAALTEVVSGFSKRYGPRAHCQTPEHFSFEFAQPDSQADIRVTIDVDGDEARRFTAEPAALGALGDRLLRSLKTVNKKVG